VKGKGGGNSLANLDMIALLILVSYTARIASKKREEGGGGGEGKKRNSRISLARPGECFFLLLSTRYGKEKKGEKEKEKRIQ